MNFEQEVTRAVESAPAYPTYQAAMELYSQLFEQREAAAKELTKLRAEFAQKAKSGVMERAKALLTTAAVETLLGVGPSHAGLKDRIEAAEERLETLDAAVRLQAVEVESLRSQLAFEVATKLRAQHERIVSRMAKSMQELTSAFSDEAELFGELYSRNLAPSSFTMARMGFDGAWQDPGYSGQYQTWLRIAEQCGYRPESAGTASKLKKMIA